MHNMESRLCACGCGEILINPLDKKGRPVKFNKNHWYKGEMTNNWKGGRYKDNRGYWYIKRPDHPYSDTRGYIQEHRLVYEYYLSIILDYDVYIPKTFDIHHIIPVKNGGTNDIWNLQLLTKSEHVSLEHSIDHSKTICLLCGSNKTYVRKNRNNVKEWYIYKNGYICSRCANKGYKKKIKLLTNS